MRPLLDDESGDPSAVTRDYLLELDTRRRAAAVASGAARSRPSASSPRRPPTCSAAPLGDARAAPGPRGAPLPGGDLSAWIGAAQRPDTDFVRFVQALALRHPELPAPLLPAPGARPTARASSMLLAAGGARRRGRARPARGRAALPARRTNGRAAPTTCCGGAPSSACTSTPAERAAVAAWCARALADDAGAGAATATEQRMELTLERIEQRVGAETYLYPLDLTLVPRRGDGAARRDAGRQDHADAPDGRPRRAHARAACCADGEDVTGVPVRERNVAMVYQQFINYPSMTVADNIASPLRLRGEQRTIAARVRELAAKLHIEPFLDAAAGRALRRPAAARRAGARAGQEGAADAARRAAGEPRLQAARGAARGAVAALRRAATRPSSTPPPSRPRRCCSAATPRCSTPASCCSTGRPPRCSTGRSRSAWRAPSAIRR